jgi:hypothetical protein
MADTAAWLVDRVLPDVGVRQWVVTFPWSLRFQLARYRPKGHEERSVTLELRAEEYEDVDVTLSK